MKRIPMILLLVAPGATLATCYLADLDLTPGLFVCGAILILNMVYAFLLPRLGFKVKQILFWNLLWKMVLKKLPYIDLRMMNCQSSFIPICLNNSVLCTQVRLHKTYIFAEIP